MKIGVLLTDVISEKHEAEFGSYRDIFHTFVNKIDPEFEIVYFDAIYGDFPEEVDACAGYIVSGSKHNAYDDEAWILSLMDFIRACHSKSKKMIGICFGHQVIARALGGELLPGNGTWGIGTHKFPVMNTKDWMTPEDAEVSILYCHQDQVKTPPAGSEILGGSDYCPVLMYSIDTHILCLQGHPEFPAGYIEALMHDRREQFGDELIAQQKPTLSRHRNELTVARWFRNFLTGK
jgi:GMP synthase-like glutamine amidotransferase